MAGRGSAWQGMAWDWGPEGNLRALSFFGTEGDQGIFRIARGVYSSVPLLTINRVSNS